MASYDNFMAVEQQQPWMIRSEIFSPWFNPAAAAAEGVHSSFASNSSDGSCVLSDELLECIFASKPDATSFQTALASVGSEKEATAAAAAVSKQRRRSMLLPASGKVAKRKSRAKKRGATTTFITADPANFRQMVQQVTGAKFAGAEEDEAPWKTAVMNPVDLGAGLATLDTSSAYLLDGSASSYSAEGTAAAAEPYVDSFCSFPTLESWKAT